VFADPDGSVLKQWLLQAPAAFVVCVLPTLAAAFGVPGVLKDSNCSDSGIVTNASSGETQKCTSNPSWYFLTPYLFRLSVHHRAPTPTDD
jgi:hypothetical protein